MVYTYIPYQGLAIGNGFIDPPSMLAYSKYLYQLGLVDDRIFDEIEKHEKSCERAILSGNNTSAYNVSRLFLHCFFFQLNIFEEVTIYIRS
jgi:vitellogenic carboxypeptidase-like protein